MLAEKSLNKFLVATLLSFILLLMLGWLVLYAQEYRGWFGIVIFLSLISGVISILIPTKNKLVYLPICLTCTSIFAFLLRMTY